MRLWRSSSNEECEVGFGPPTAAYTFQYARKVPDAFAHDEAYVLPVLYDSLEDVGGDLSGMLRP